MLGFISRQKIIIAISALLVVGIFLIIFKPFNRTSNSAEIKRGNIREFIVASGKADANKEADLSFKTTGKLAVLPVKKGDTVKKDQVVAKLDTRELELELVRATYDQRNYQAIAEYTVDQVKGHDKDETLYQKQLRTTAEVNRDKAVSAVESAQKALDDAALYAPFDGEVVEVNTQINEWVSAFSTTPQIKIIDFSKINFTAEVDQKKIAALAIGQKAIVRFDAYPDKEYTGKITQISKDTKEGTGGGVIVEVTIEFDDDLSNLIVGLEGDAEIINQEKENVLLAPKGAIFKKNNVDMVRSGSGEKEIKLGVFDGNNWEVLSGLSEGEKVYW